MNKIYIIVGGVVIFIIILLFVFKDKLAGLTAQKRTIDTGGSEGDLGDLYIPIDDGSGSGTSTTSNIITGISARYKTGKPLYKPSTWRDITSEVTAYVNRNEGVINIPPAYSWIRQFGLPLSWGVFNGLITMPSPWAEIEFTYTTTNNQNPTTRKFTVTQKLLVP